MTVPWEDLDPGIREVVKAFHSAGLVTLASCQGHSQEDAWVIIEASTVEPLTTMRHVEDIIRARDWDANCRLSLVYSLAMTSDIWVEARWWGQVPYR